MINKVEMESLIFCLGRKKGLTLIGAMIAIVVLAIGILGILPLFPVSLKITKSAEMDTLATQLGQAKIEEMVSRSYQNISSSTEEYTEIPGFEAFKRTVEVDYYDPQNSTTTETDSGIKKVTVNVFWKSSFGTKERTIILTSLISKR